MCTASLAVPVAALLMTYSRSGWVSFALAAVVFIALWDKRLLPLIVVAAVAALIATLVLPVLQIASAAVVSTFCIRQR